MSAKFNMKYQTSSGRLKNYDYTLPGMYFITINSKNKRPLFGGIEDSLMKLSQIGLIAENCWKRLPDHFDNIRLDRFIVMPDHIHGIITITHRTEKTGKLCLETIQKKDKAMAAISPKTGSLGNIIRSYKSAVARFSHEFMPDFEWQPGYYDHIIRDFDELLRIQEYIKENPSNYEK
jgi:REP element-mobilizing transposase RayT